MWAQESEGERGSSSEDERDIQCEILESQRDDAHQQLCDLEAVSSQLLKEMNVLEIQFHIERSCRESAEALAVKVTKENKVLKRASQMTPMMPLIPELPENCSAVTFDPQADPPEAEETLLLENQAKTAELQVSVDGLLSEKMQLEQQVEGLTKEQVQFREQLALEVEEKEAVLREMSKQNKTMNKINRVSQLVTEEFTDMSQKLELEQGLRQHAEVFAHQMLVQQEAAAAAAARGESGRSEAGLRLQLQRALEDISNISTALCDIQRCYRDPAAAPPELQNLREQLERSEEEKTSLEEQLSAANGRVTQLQEEVQRLREKMSRVEEEKAAPAPAPPPPPPPPPPPLPPSIPTAVTNPLDLLRRRRAEGRADPIKAAPLLDTKTRAVEEMMERIKRGIVLRPVEKTQEDDGSWKDQRSENRKSAILELKGILDDRKRQQLRRLPSRRGLGRHVVEAELLQVLHRRRRAMGENQDQTWDPRPGAPRAPAAGGAPWAGESGAGAPVLRRLKQNREKRDSRIRASALMVSQDN